MSVQKFAIVVATAIGGYALYVLIYGLFICPTRHLPGPFITRFSQIPHLLLVFGGTHCTDIRKLHDRYGPIVRLAPQRVSVLDPEAALRAFTGQNQSKLIWDKDPANCRAVRGGLKVDNVLSISGPKESQRMRRLVGAPFAKKFLFDQEQLFKDCTKRMTERISKLCEGDPRVDVLVEYKNYALDILTEFAFGGYFKGASNASGVSVTRLAEEVPMGNVFADAFPLLFRLFKCLPFERFQWVRSRDEFMNICDMSIRAYREKVVPGSRKDALAVLLASTEDPDSPLTDEELVGAASIFLVAGVDTTAVTLAYISFELAKHPELFKTLQEELSKYTDVDSLKSTELEQLPMLNAVIKETLRMWPPVSPFARLVPPEGTTLGGCHIPGNVLVVREAWSVCHDPVIYPDPNAFKPERWFHLSREEEIRMWEQTMVFSYGPRICLGREMALMELRMLMAALILKYTWTGVPDEPGKWDEEMKPYDLVLIQPWNRKCVLKMQQIGRKKEVA